MRLATVPSETVPGKTYDLRLGRFGPYCTCPAWAYQHVPLEFRTCKHMRRLAVALGR
jgi:predicted nucleic acid-binding Zn finger protein